MEISVKHKRVTPVESLTLTLNGKEAEYLWYVLAMQTEHHIISSLTKPIYGKSEEKAKKIAQFEYDLFCAVEREIGRPEED